MNGFKRISLCGAIIVSLFLTTQSANAACGWFPGRLAARFVSNRVEGVRGRVQARQAARSGQQAAPGACANGS
jgi:hypothetical protein